LNSLRSAFPEGSFSHVAFTQRLAGVERKTLGKAVCNLAGCRSDIIAAMDFIISGI
jgi:toxin CcdB